MYHPQQVFWNFDTNLEETDLTEEHLGLGEGAGHGGSVVREEEGDVAAAHLTQVVRLADLLDFGVPMSRFASFAYNILY